MKVWNCSKFLERLVDVFKRKLPLIGKNDFEFVKRERQCIVRPVIKQGYKSASYPGAPLLFIEISGIN